MEERISEFKERNLEMIQVEEERESRSKNKWGNSIRTIWLFCKGKIRIMGITEKEKREKKVESLLKEIIAVLYNRMYFLGYLIKVFCVHSFN